VLPPATSTSGSDVPTFTVNPSAPVPGQPVAINVTVPPSNGATPTGTVTIYDNGKPIGTGTLNANGTVTVNLPAGTLPAGSDTITVGYNGAANNKCRSGRN